MMRQTLISAVIVALAVLGNGIRAADAPAPTEGKAIYIVILHLESGAPEPELAALGGQVLESRLNRRVVLLPVSAADALRRHEKVAIVQRIWSGESFETWRGDAAAGRPPLGAVRAEAYAAAPTSSGPYWSRTYSYDGSGNITAAGADKFWYDTAGRLAKAEVNATTETYGYDAFGNLTWQSAGKPFTVDAANNRVSGLPYDAAGNLTGNGAGRAYHYDALGMMAGATRDLGLYDRMVYTADDERIAVMTRGHADPADDRTTFRVRDFSGKVLREWEQQGTGPYKFWQRDYMYAGGTLVAGDRAVAGTSSGQRHFHLDHLGSTRLITRADGVRISEHDYLPFGKEATSVVQEHLDFGYGPADPLKFTGHERDYHGLENVDNDDYIDYMHARYYDPNLGRFLSVDPVLDVKRAVRTPQMWNRYAYVMNNPVRYVDPDGRLVQLAGTQEEQQKLLALIRQNLAEKDRNLVTIGKNGMLQIGAKAQGSTTAFTMLKNAVRDKNATVGVAFAQTALVKPGPGPVRPMQIDLQTTGGGLTTRGSHTMSGNIEVRIDPRGNPQGQPMSIVMGHELLGHGWDLMFVGTSSERSATLTENYIRRDLGMPLRLPVPNDEER